MSFNEQFGAPGHSLGNNTGRRYSMANYGQRSQSLQRQTLRRPNTRRQISNQQLWTKASGGNDYRGTSGHQLLSVPSSNSSYQGMGGRLGVPPSSPFGTPGRRTVSFANTGCYPMVNADSLSLRRNTTSGRYSGTGCGLAIPSSNGNGGTGGGLAVSSNGFSRNSSMPFQSSGNYQLDSSDDDDSYLPESMNNETVNRNISQMEGVMDGLETNRSFQSTQSRQSLPPSISQQRHLKRDHRGAEVGKLIAQFEALGRPPASQTLQRHLKRDHRGPGVGKLVSHFENLGKKPGSSYGGPGSCGYSSGGYPPMDTGLQRRTSTSSQPQWGTSSSSYSGGGLEMPRTRSLGTSSSGGYLMVSDDQRLPSLESLSRTPSKPTLERHLKRDHRGKQVSQLIDYYEGKGRPQTPPTLQRHLKRDHRGSRVGKLISHFENLQKQPVSSSYGGLGHRRTTTPSNGYSMASTGQRTTSLASLSRSNSQSQWDSLSAGYNGIGGGLEVSQRSGYGLGSNGSGYSTTGGGWTPKPIGPQYDESSQSSGGSGGSGGSGHMNHDHQGKHVGQLVAKFQQMGQQVKNGGQEPPPPPPPPLDIGPSPNVNELIAEFEAKNEPQDDDNFDLDNFKWPEMPGPPGPPPPSLASSDGSWSEWDWYKTGLTGA